MDPLIVRIEKDFYPPTRYQNEAGGKSASPAMILRVYRDETSPPCA